MLQKSKQRSKLQRTAESYILKQKVAWIISKNLEKTTCKFMIVCVFQKANELGGELFYEMAL